MLLDLVVWLKNTSTATMSFLLGYLHQLVDTALSFLKLIQSREIGWLTIVRETGEFKREQQPLWKKFKLVLLFNPLTEWLDQTHLFRLYTHEKNIEAGLSKRSCITDDYTDNY